MTECESCEPGFICLDHRTDKPCAHQWRDEKRTTPHTCLRWLSNNGNHTGDFKYGQDHVCGCGVRVAPE